MPAITPQQFVAKWSQIQQKETAASQSHFNDICALVGHLPPLAYDPAGQNFAFEAHTGKPGGQKGFADVYFRDHFIWEYKGPHKDLDKAYQQLQLYRESLSNPPLLITSDIHTIHIHTNFNNYPRQTHTITLADILAGPGVEKLRWAFFQPDKFTPDKDQEQITKATAVTFLAVANAMKQHQQLTGESYTPEQLAHFLVRLLFALFAEDLGLLPHTLFTQIVQSRGGNYADLQPMLRDLFAAMRAGGRFGLWKIRYFDGTLFDDDFVPEIPHDLGKTLLQAAGQDWSGVDPSIFGTLFERIIDESKRAQLGAHYTSEADIMLIVEPVLMAPLRQQWEVVRGQANQLLLSGGGAAAREQAAALLRDFAAAIAAVKVLDAACGSGNFLYVALRELLDLQKQVIAYAARKELPSIPLTAGPGQLYGIEVNPYAHELAQVTVWIGYLQWRFENGFGEMADPVLRPLRNIRRMDAILAYDADGSPTEPAWPAADVIIGNPPFLGGNKIRQELGDATVDSLFKLYDGRVPAFADLVCYWFEKARAQIANGQTRRAGLIATNSIRGGANREVLKRIKQTGDIFMAWSDNPWVLDGAAVRVSIIGFDDGSQAEKRLDGEATSVVNSDLTSSADVSTAVPLDENKNVCFMGPSAKGSFDIDYAVAKKMLDNQTNQNGRPNSDVVRPVASAIDLVQTSRNKFTIDFSSMSIEEARKYQLPFEYVEKHVLPERENKAGALKDKWWQYGRPRIEMRVALEGLSKYITTPGVSKHRIFVWQDIWVLSNQGTLVFAREDDYFFGVLHSRPHEIWALRLGTWLGKGNDPRYTPTTTFETFPFPWPPGAEPAEDADPRVQAIAHWARTLVAWRDVWLNPPPPAAGTIDVAYQKMLKNRTLTNLYNGLQYYRETVQAGQIFLQSAFDKVTRQSVNRPQIEELHDIHTALDRAVLDAYGWPPTLTDEQILERLLALNLARAGGVG